ncbi:hypothetical protein D7316_04883 [Gordonia insulae]|uniref:Acyclic terpene utilisation N-terminal domain-containing protein n=1 Tax=Gordonia insulae TaxID=2420509 RepID=A0A3G8JTR3_9ACTN|nr:hypothetical protein D7316_04883 [Gordonia insulae]
MTMPDNTIPDSTIPNNTMPDNIIRIGNASGFYGDRFSAVREMLDGGDLDFLTGDYLAELTMLILGRDRMKDPKSGYAKTFLRQMEECLGLAIDKGVRIVTNAGGLNPHGLAVALRELAENLGVSADIAFVDGDDLLDRAGDLGLGTPLTANAYLGAFGIKTALDAGAEIVVTGRVTDASLTVGPAASVFGWGYDDLDELAGAVVAGHVIECGAQATGGNYAFFGELPRMGHLGFPIAEVAADGTSVITKHPGTGGAVTVGTVTAQLLYEVGGPRYLGPDVTTRLDTIDLAQAGDDRVAISGVRGEAPPATTKVSLNHLAGVRNEITLILTGLDIEAKAELFKSQFTAALPTEPAEIDWELSRLDRPDAETEEQASALLRCVVRDPDAKKVGRAFSSTAVELALASYPGFAATAPPVTARPTECSSRVMWMPRQSIIGWPCKPVWSNGSRRVHCAPRCRRISTTSPGRRRPTGARRRCSRWAPLPVRAAATRAAARTSVCGCGARSISPGSTAPSTSTCSVSCCPKSPTSRSAATDCRTSTPSTS